MRSVMDGMHRIPKKMLGSAGVDNARRSLTFPIPDSGYGGNRELQYLVSFIETPTHLDVPRYYPVPIDMSLVTDHRCKGEHVETGWFKSKLINKPGKVQAAGVDALCSTEGGILACSPGKGKTIMALAAASRIPSRALVVTPTRVVFDQWIDRICEHTTYTKDDIGIVQGANCDWNKPIIIAMVHSLSERTYADSLYNSVGVIIFDEVHRMGAPHFIQTIPRFPARIRWGLSATVMRRDKLHKAFMYHIGPIVHEMTQADVVPSVWRVITNFTLQEWQYRNAWNHETNLAKLHTNLCKLQPRNKMLASLVLQAYRSGRKILALSRRIEQLNEVRELAIELSNPRDNFEKVSAVLTGATKQEQRKSMLADRRVIFAIEQIAGMGLDQPDLDTLFYLSPSQNVEQNVGRIERECEGKKEPMVVDMVDKQIQILWSMAAARQKIYEARGYKISEITR